MGDYQQDLREIRRTILRQHQLTMDHLDTIRDHVNRVKETSIAALEQACVERYGSHQKFEGLCRMCGHLDPEISRNLS